MKRFATFILMMIMVCSLSLPAYAQTPEPATGGTPASEDENMYNGVALMTAQEKPLPIPGGQGP